MKTFIRTNVLLLASYVGRISLLYPLNKWVSNRWSIDSLLLRAVPKNSFDDIFLLQNSQVFLDMYLIFEQYIRTNYVSKTWDV